MPHVTVMFNPDLVEQETIDKLKPWLQQKVAMVLSAKEAFFTDKYRGYDVRDVKTPPEEILVTQHATHPTDVNVSPIQINIQAGQYKGRDGDRIVALLGEVIRDEGIIPNDLLGDDESCIFVMFHEYNGFGFIPKP